MPTDTLRTALPGFAEIPDLPKNTLEDVELVFRVKIRRVVGTLNNALVVRAWHSTAPVALVWATQKWSDADLLIASCLPFYHGKPLKNLIEHPSNWWPYEPYGTPEETAIGKVLTLQEYTGGPHCETSAYTQYIPGNFYALPDYSENNPNYDKMKANRERHYEGCYNLQIPDATSIADFENHEWETHFFTGRKFRHDKGLKIIISSSPCDPMDIIERLRSIKK